MQIECRPELGRDTFCRHSLMEHRAGEESPREGGLGPSEGRWVPTGGGGGGSERCTGPRGRQSPRMPCEKDLVSQRLGNWGFPLRTGRGKGKFCAPQGFRGHLCTQEKIMMGRYGGSLLTQTCGIRVHVCKWGWGAEVGSISPFL